MGFRFRKSIRLGKGVRLSLGRKSASLGLGGKGIGVGLRTSGARVRASLPGSGLSYSKKIGGGRRRGGSGIGGMIIFVILIWVLIKAIF